jgi:DNA replication protein DnaC
MEPIGNIFASVLQPGIGAAEKADKDYTGEDGLLHCGECGQPKEMRIDILGENRIVKVCCRCQEKQLEAESRRQRELRRRISADETLETLLSIDAVELPSATFAANDGASERNMRQLSRYVDRFDDMARQNVGIMLCGEPGCGKTWFAEAIANALINRGLLVMFTSVRKIAALQPESKAYTMRHIKTCDLLVLDDLGAERDTSYMAEQAYEIVNTRYSAKKPMIITTNLNPAMMAAEKDLTYARTFQRVLEMCTAVKVDGGSRRQELAAQKAAAWRKMMEDV